MAYAQSPYGNILLSRSFGSAAFQPHPGRRTRGTMNYDVRKGHAVTESSSQCFENCFLSSESASQMFDPARTVPDLSEFLLSKTTWEQRISWVLNPTSYVSDLNQINAMSDDLHVTPPSLR